MILATIILVVLYLVFKPSIDELETGELILWYGIKKRKYIVFDFF